MMKIEHYSRLVSRKIQLRNGESSMKYIAKRSLSMLMALVLVISLFSGVVLPASAASYTYNWGYRGQVATSLSTAAVNFYSGTSYDTMTSYAGSSSISSVPGSSLYSYLQTLMSSRHSHITSYDETKELYRYTDCQGGGGAISSFYSGRSIGPDWDGSWNREHTWPNSKGEGSAENDIMMLRPTSTIENSSRGNTAYGESSGYYNPNSESGGAYDLRGDVARIMLYVYVRWGNTSYMWGSSGVMESRDVLLKWMKADPVDTWELGRNDAVQSITGTRNVFVDYPELAFLLFGEVVPADMTTPSGMAGASTYNITATSNDTAMGTVSVAGKNVTAVPAEGYLATGYEILSGDATVIRNGNTFVVNAASDCQIRILFAPKTLVELTYVSNGVTLSSQQVYGGDPVTLPAYTGNAPEGCQFLGWVDAPVSSTETRPAYYRAGESYTVNGATTIYALFSYTAEGGVSGGTWTLVTSASELDAGDQIVIAANAKGVVAGAIEKTYLKEVSTTFSDDKSTIPTLAADASIFTLGGNTGAWTLTDASGNVLGCTEVKKLAYGSGTTTWTISVSGNNATIQSTASGCGWIQYNAGSPRFTTYTSSQVLPQLYVLDTAAGSTFYTTSTCAHEDTVDVTGSAANCTASGYTAGVYCNDCSSYISGHQIIPAYGHSYSSVVTPPTATEAGYTTHTCGGCGDVYTSDPVPALGVTYTVSFSVPADVAPMESMDCNSAGILLPQAEEVEGYTFCGWAEEAVEDTAEDVAFHKAGDKYVALADTTLYALYTYTEGGGAGGYTLVTDVNDLELGCNVVIASFEDNAAISTNQKTNNRAQAEITRNDDNTIALGADVAVFILGQGTVSNTYSFYCAANSGYLYAGSSSSNHLKTQATLNDNGSFTIEITESGVATVKAQGTNTRNWLRYNKTSSLFACYGSGQNDICLYVEGDVGTTYYTTNIAHRHSGTYHAAQAATCTAAGNVAYYSCACGVNFADSSCTQVLTTVVIPVLDHTFTAQNMEEKYLKAEANCQSGAVYYLSCAVCGTSSNDDNAVFVYGGTNPYNHPGEGIFAGETPATCTTAGSTGDTVCADCGEVMVYGTVISATGHADAISVAQTVSTCKTNGVKFHYHCDACGGDYLEKGIGAVAQTAESLQLPLDPDNHEGETELRGASDATCQADGYTGDTHCLGCGEKLLDGEAIPSLTHTNAWTDNGDGTHSFSCAVCGSAEIENQKHTYKDGVCHCGAEQPAQAVVNGERFATLAEALNAAGNGGTVILLQDAQEKTVALRDNVTLDLNGYALTAQYVFAVKGTNIVDNSEANTGVLKVDPERMMINADNAHLPIWNGEGFIFVDILSFQEMYTTNEAGQKQYIFLPTFETIAHQYLVQGMENSHVKIAIRMTWEIDTGSAFQNFVYNDKTVKAVIDSYAGGYYSQAFYATITNSEYADFELKVVLISDTGVELMCN